LAISTIMVMLRTLFILIILLVIISEVVEAKKGRPGKKPGKKPGKGGKGKPGKGKPGKKPGKKPSKPSTPKPVVVVSELQKSFNDLVERVEALDKKLKNLDSAVTKAEQAAEQRSLDRHLPGDAEDSITVVDADYNTGTTCGPHDLTSWTTNLDIYNAPGAAADSANSFSAGTFTAQVAGWYHICVFLRFKNSGNSNDVTLLKNGVTVIAAFGNAITYDWRSTGTCVTVSLAANENVKVRHQSGSGSDCVEETGWKYGKFIVHNVGNQG